MLENIVYFEHKSRKQDVDIGKNNKKEIDFVTKIRNESFYIQVCRQIPENSDREVENLLEIKDSYPIYFVTLSELSCGNIQGVKIIHIVDFLLKSEY